MTLRKMSSLSERMERARKMGLEALSRSGDKGIMLFGPPGIGKTHLVVGLTRVALAASMVATFENVPDLIQRIQDTYDYERMTGEEPANTSRRKIVARLCAHDIVALDDIGRERATEDARSIMYEIVNNLYERRRTVLVTTNLTLEEYEDRYDEAIRSRLAHMTNRLKVDGDDRRRTDRYV
jgi:DNA replication protein DnaC